MKYVLNLGAGTQSSCVALKCAHGEITPMPDAAICADTQWESAGTYDYLRFLMSDNVLPFPVHVVTNGNLPGDILTMAHGTTREGGRPQPPFFTLNPDGSTGFVSRQCSGQYKIKPIMKKVRELCGITGRVGPKEVVVEQYIGISTDEASRMKPSQHRWSRHRFPLIEQRMSRGDCIEWLKRNDYPIPPKSSCIGCPFHNDLEWRNLSAADMASVAELEREVQAGSHHFGLKSKPFFHRSCKPIDEVDFSTSEDKGQLNMFENECEGMCGV